MNQIILSGTIVNPIKVNTSKKGNKFLKNTIKVIRENNPSSCDYIDFMCVGQNALMLENSYKGAMIEISGELQTSAFEKEGKKFKTYTVFAKSVQLLDVSVNGDADIQEDLPIDDSVAEDDLPF